MMLSKVDCEMSVKSIDVICEVDYLVPSRGIGWRFIKKLISFASSMTITPIMT